jgi:hypothetical protein
VLTIESWRAVGSFPLLSQPSFLTFNSSFAPMPLLVPHYKACPLFPITDFSSFSATFDANLPRTGQAHPTWKSEAPVYGWAFHLWHYFKTLM